MKIVKIFGFVNASNDTDNKLSNRQQCQKKPNIKKTVT